MYSTISFNVLRAERTAPSKVAEANPAQPLLLNQSAPGNSLQRVSSVESPPLNQSEPSLSFSSISKFWYAVIFISQPKAHPDQNNQRRDFHQWADHSCKSLTGFKTKDRYGNCNCKFKIVACRSEGDYI